MRKVRVIPMWVSGGASNASQGLHVPKVSLVASVFVCKFRCHK